jgi:hypothetical protein
MHAERSTHRQYFILMHLGAHESCAQHRNALANINARAPLAAVHAGAREASTVSRLRVYQRVTVTACTVLLGTGRCGVSG